MKPKQVETYLEDLPTPEEITRRIAKNQRERQILRQLLKLSKQRRQVEEVSPCHE